VSHNFTK